MQSFKEDGNASAPESYCIGHSHPMDGLTVALTQRDVAGLESYLEG